MEELKPFKAKEVADVLRVNVRVVYSLIKSGKLQAVRVGRDWRITRTAIEAYLEGGILRQAGEIAQRLGYGK